MISDMQKWTPNVASIIEHAKNIYPEQEVVSRMVSGEIHKTNYKEVCIRSRKLASALEKDGYKKGDVLATLALNTYRHLEMYYGISGMGAITHTLNFRLHPEQAVYIINHAEDKIIFVETPFIPMMEALKDQLGCVEKYIILCDQSEMPETDLKNAISYEEYIQSGDENYEWPAMDDDAACGLCYTSGTTGNPKGVLYAHKSNILHAQAALTGLTISPDESILMVVPLFHVLAAITRYGWVHVEHHPWHGLCLAVLADRYFACAGTSVKHADHQNHLRCVHRIYSWRSADHTFVRGKRSVGLFPTTRDNL